MLNRSTLLLYFVALSVLFVAPATAERSARKAPPPRNALRVAKIGQSLELLSELAAGLKEIELHRVGTYEYAEQTLKTESKSSSDVPLRYGAEQELSLLYANIFGEMEYLIEVRRLLELSDSTTLRTELTESNERLELLIRKADRLLIEESPQIPTFFSILLDIQLSVDGRKVGLSLAVSQIVETNKELVRVNSLFQTLRAYNRDSALFDRSFAKRTQGEEAGPTSETLPLYLYNLERKTKSRFLHEKVERLVRLNDAFYL